MLKNTCFLIIFSLFFSFTANATHIVGGDFKITMLNNGSISSTYNVQLRLFRDNINGLVQLPNTLSIGIYQIGTNNLESTKTLNLTNPGGTIVPLGDACFNPTQYGVQVQEGIYQNPSNQPLTLPNSTFGYYLQYETCCRNDLIDNLMNPTSDGITIMAIIPDPALGQNSSPDFGDYPTDAYFCVNNIKTFTWPVNDPDGDSLVYSLVAPLDEGNLPGAGNTSPGFNPYPFYPKCVFSTPYTVINMIGGSPPMSINRFTGEITASPSFIGFFAFAVKVEEYRNGIKIGEVRRDAQYASLPSPPCIISVPPTISINSSQGNNQNDSISFDVYSNDSICFDFELGVNDPNDSLYILLSSNDIDLSATFVPPIQINNSLTGYLNWENVIDDTVTFSPNYLNSNGYLGNLENIYLRYCWLPPCGGADSVFLLNMDAYSVDCSGQNFKSSTILLNTVPSTPTILDIPSTLTLSVDDTLCIDLLAQDTVNNLDTLYIVPSSNVFDFDGTFVPPFLDTTNNVFYYSDFNDSIGNTISMESFNNSNNIYSAIGSVGLRYCWIVDCDAAQTEIFDIKYYAYSSICESDTIYDSLLITVYNEPEPLNIDVPSSMTLKYDSITCVDLYAIDNNLILDSNYNDTLFLEPTSSYGFDFSGSYVAPEENLNGSFFYADFTLTDSLGNLQLIDTLYMNNYSHINNITSAIGEIGLRFCWKVNCEDIFQKEFDLDFMAISTICGSDTSYNSVHFEVDPPSSSAQPIPNMFSPNEDGNNDYFQLTPFDKSDETSRYNDPCLDKISVVIYNRWGKKVFESNDPNFNWDGTINGEGNSKCNSGLYLVVIEGSYGSTFDSVTFERIPFQIKDEYWIQLFR